MCGRVVRRPGGRGGGLKVSVRTAWSSELEGDTAAVTSALISPDEMSVRSVCACGKKNVSLQLFGLQIAEAGGEE